MDSASPHLARLAATPRPAGGAATGGARRYCADVLRSLGFSLQEQSFEYSAFPGSWTAPLAGAAAFVGAIALFMGRHVPALLIVAFIGLPAIYLALRSVGSAGVLGFPAMRRRGVNLQAVRGTDEPMVWLVAHLDSKWQPVSMIARIGGIVVTTAAGGALLLLSIFPVGGDRAAAIVLILACLGSLPIILSVVRDGSYGAVDNASGVAAVLEAAAAIPSSARTGVLITDAEELALAGARAWAKTRSPGIALNCDSIDDSGQFTVMYAGSEPTALVAALRRHAIEIGMDLRTIRLLPGVLTDSVALASAGWQTVTLSRGNARTLQRIHTSRDTLGSMCGTGIATAARVLAAIATELG